ncbi:hypothetical protein IVA79_34640 [Bradyrhizobium sp. 138]|uniref:hypothetical protein n=1 Tax=Bradyrhizobium sp. 138 TaxID=2782615 RepID=UPI001FFA58C6|nr:hypothetical protein [Bradyrhizobium sp. 138]MCK1738975.1 hypothetical protein [Bradyrhizobium sp. 138]
MAIAVAAFLLRRASLPPGVVVPRHGHHDEAPRIPGRARFCHAAAAVCAAAAQAGKVYRLATVTPNAAATEISPAGQILIKVLGQRGFVLGQNLTFEPRGERGDVAKLPGLVAELKTHHADVIVIIG